MGNKCSWQCIRLWHTKRNWLAERNELTKPYSSTATLFACIMPFAFLIGFIMYTVYVQDSQGLDNHFVLNKDGNPHRNIDHSYYEHMYQPIYFLNKDDQLANLTLYQYYKPNNNNDGWDCSDYAGDKNNVQITKLDGKTREAAILCYYDNPYRTWTFEGLVLCRDDSFADNSKFSNQYVEDDNQTLAALDIELSAARAAYGEGNVYDPQDILDLTAIHLMPRMSATVTLQLWIEYDWERNSGYSGTWIGNQVAVKSVQNDYSMLNIPMTSDARDDRRFCYGVRVLMDRQVYEVHDGGNKLVAITAVFTLIGAGYSFVLLLTGLCAKWTGFIVVFCCKSLHQKDEELKVNTTAAIQQNSGDAENELTTRN